MHVLTDETDEVLFDLLKEDSNRAFTALYRRYWDRLLEVALQKKLSQEDAEEAVQQVFINIWNNRYLTELKYSFNTYVSACLKYEVYANLAKKKKIFNVPIDGISESSFIDNGTQEFLNFVEIRDQLETIITNLPEKCQMVFRLSRESGFSNAEISGKMNISLKMVEAHMTKALKSIKNKLRDSDFLPFISIISFLLLKK
ncbi:sigma-70 family RNA polymerase sigma factor [Mucilaginibacter sp. PAMB04274]|uniref:sigma-70 family RNA polymerase sigma factor n=1 Tax=Mucilaginibacter sp. PAMB04274 TaxID=3138568 RepID=UPI0031F6456D